jgi:hypothetical protein
MTFSGVHVGVDDEVDNLYVERNIINDLYWMLLYRLYRCGGGGIMYSLCLQVTINLIGYHT